jgi:hypothetical protein
MYVGGLNIMSLPDDLMKIANGIFKENKINVRFESMFLFRPVVSEPPFEKMEVIRDWNRIHYCDPICTVFLIVVDNRRMEYKAEFKNKDGDLSLKSYKLRFCDYFPHEQPEEIEKMMSERVKYILLFLSAILKAYVSRHTSSGTTEH